MKEGSFIRVLGRLTLLWPEEWTMVVAWVVLGVVFWLMRKT